jgi:DNA-binding NtrC family response regulator
MVVEDDAEVARSIARRLGIDGVEVELSGGAQHVVARLDAGLDDWEVVILDVGLPDLSGIEVLYRFRDVGSLASVIMLTGDSTAQTAAECMRAGAFYYLTKPFEAHQLSSMVQSAARHSQLRRELAGARRSPPAAELLIGTSPAMRRLRDALDRLAQQAVPILIQGDSGTGKELVARALHERGPRASKRFVALNCSAIPESLIDSELFGHTRGAFTGATTDRQGVFVEADRGTLFLDEIGDMPMAVQGRLLRVLQEGEVRALGGSGVRHVDVRVVAASNIDLAAAAEQQRFRQDLFYRLNVVSLRIPALRERDGDLPLLAAHFLRKHGGADPPTLSPDALDALIAYSWPGNVRELENALHSAIALRVGDVIGVEALPAHVAGRRGTLATMIANDIGETDVPLTEAKRRASAAFERRYLERVMARANGSVTVAARIAGLDRTNFRRLLQKYGLK